MQVLCLRPESFGADKYACTGPQIASVLALLVSMSETENCAWYSGAINANGTRFAPFDERSLLMVDDIAGLIETIRSTTQLLDGIFVAARGPTLGPVAGVVTADGPMEPVAETSTVEVHAFDTTWIEIFSNDPSLLAKMQQRFPGELKTLDVRS